jgi:hypothetical protein
MYRYCGLTKVQVTQLNTSFETRAELFCAGLKAQRNEGGGRMLLGDNTVCGPIVVRTIGVLCVGVGFSTALPHRPHVY